MFYDFHLLLSVDWHVTLGEDSQCDSGVSAQKCKAFRYLSHRLQEGERILEDSEMWVCK